MDQRDYLRFHKEFTSRMYQIIESDSKGSEGVDPFSDFMFVEDIGVCSALYGYLISKTDKFRKITKFLKRGIDKIPLEVIEDTLLEEANLNVLLIAYLKSLRLQTESSEKKRSSDEDTGVFKEENKIPPSERRESEGKDGHRLNDRLGRDSIMF